MNGLAPFFGRHYLGWVQFLAPVKSLYEDAQVTLCVGGDVWGTSEASGRYPPRVPYQSYSIWYLLGRSHSLS
jgi:hypothetical protein